MSTLEIKENSNQPALNLGSVLVLKEKPAGQLSTYFKCTNCDSNTFSHIVMCPSCRGTDLVCGAVIQHLSCMKFDLESTFIHQNGLTKCPECDRVLTSLGCDYLRPGIFFKCMGCGEFTGTAIKGLKCGRCSRAYELPDRSNISALQYDSEQFGKNQVSMYDDSKRYPELAKKLVVCGFEMGKDTALRGSSGIVHDFSVVSKPSNVRGSDIVVIDVRTDRISIGETAVLSLFAKTLDCNIKNKILVAIPGLDQGAKLLALNYGVAYVEGESMEIAGRALQVMLMQQKEIASTHVKSARKTKPNLEKRASVRRGALDIMTDILRIVEIPSSKAEIMSSANMSYEQCQRYMPAMEKLGLLCKSIEDGVRVQFTISEKGREYLSNMSRYGRIAEGKRSVWDSRRISEVAPANIS